MTNISYKFCISFYLEVIKASNENKPVKIFTSKRFTSCQTKMYVEGNFFKKLRFQVKKTSLGVIFQVDFSCIISVY